MLGRRIDDDIRAPFQRLLIERRGEDVVDDDLGAGLARQCRDRLQVHEIEHRIGRRFQEHDVGPLGEGGLPLLEVVAVHQDGLDAPARQQLRHDVVARPEQRARRNDARSRLQLAGQGGEHRRHARGRHFARFRAFQGGQALFQHRVGRVAEARIDEARILARPRERGFGVGGVVVDEARIEVERFAGFEPARTLRAFAHETRGGAPRFADLVFLVGGHRRNSGTKKPRPRVGVTERAVRARKSGTDLLAG